MGVGKSVFCTMYLDVYKRQEIDKVTYSIEDDPDSKTNTTLEMLRKVPLVTVDGEDKICLLYTSRNCKNSFECIDRIRYRHTGKYSSFFSK